MNAIGEVDENIKSEIMTRKVFISDDVILKLVETSDFTEKYREDLKSALFKYRHVFSVNDEDIEEYTGKSIKLELKDDKDPSSFIKPRRIAYSLRHSLDEKLQKLVDKNIQWTAITRHPNFDNKSEKSALL